MCVYCRNYCSVKEGGRRRSSLPDGWACAAAANSSTRCGNVHGLCGIAYGWCGIAYGWYGIVYENPPSPSFKRKKAIGNLGACPIDPRNNRPPAAIPALHPNTNRRGTRDGHVQDEVGIRVPDLEQARARSAKLTRFQPIDLFQSENSRLIVGKQQKSSPA